MGIVHPDLDWYREKSLKNGVSTRCPYANMRTCPRYYFTWSLLGEYDIATKMDEVEDEKILAMWKESPLFPSLGEQDTYISGCDGRMSSMSNACPEVSYDVFGLFASFLSRYSDEVDISEAHKRLEAEATVSSDWRWNWQFVHQAHYFDCSLYSSINSTDQIGMQPQCSESEIIELKPNIYGVSIDLKAAYSWIKKKLYK